MNCKQNISLQLMSSYLIHIAFSTFQMQHNIFVYSFLETVVLTLELAWFSKDLSKAWFVSCDAKSTSIFVHQSFTLKTDFSAAHAALFCFFWGQKAAKFN